MRQFFLTVAGVFAGLTLFAVAVVVFLFGSLFALSSRVESSVGERTSGAVHAQTVLLVDLRRTLADQSPPSPLAGGVRPSLVALIEALAQAETDERVKGVLVRASEGGLDPAQAEEIHNALLALRSHGKFVYAHAQGFEDTSVTSYLAASAADRIWIQPTASFAATGLAAETPFLGGLFAKIGVDPEFEAFHEYKNAVNTYTETSYTPQHREAILSLLTSIYGQSIERAAEARSAALAGQGSNNPGDQGQADQGQGDQSQGDQGFTAATLRGLLEAGPYSAERSKDLKLTDELGQVIDAREAALDKAGEDAELMDVFAYLRAVGRPWQSGPVIAVVSGQGDVQTGEISPTYFSSSSGLYSDTIADAIIDAADDEEVRAIVLRIDSPGGSATASDQIWDAVIRAKAKGKKVVASFGSLAASGGYYLAVGADRIVADANTITGSIGVFGGKLVVDGALDKIGVNIDSLNVGGDFTLAYSGSTPFTDRQRAAFRTMLQEIYDDFTGKVAAGRGLSAAEVDAVAHGRVWSGADALSRKLVDKIGGYRDAIALAKELADIPAESDIRVRHFPKEPSPFKVFQDMFGVSMQDARALSELSRAADELGLIEAARARRSLDGDVMLLAPELRVR